MSEKVLEIRDLRVTFDTPSGPLEAVRGVDLDVSAGELLGVVGESGSGKSVSFLATMGLLPARARVTGSVLLAGEQLIGASNKYMRSVRGRSLSMIFQDPLSALNPVHRIGNQIAEMLQSHQDLSKRDAEKRAIELLDIVGIPQPSERATQFPHEFSGGMRQRVVIAIAIANNPKVLIADEPTTALDVTVQAQILEVIERVQDRFGTAVVLITHDLGVVARYADRVVVMYAGSVVESAPAAELYAHPRHPYTQGLMASVPRLDGDTNVRLVPIEGQPPDLARIPDGCAFAPRCKHATDTCRQGPPALRDIEPGHQVACILEV